MIKNTKTTITTTVLDPNTSQKKVFTVEKSKPPSITISRANWTSHVLLGISVCLLALACMSVIQKSSSLAGLWLPTALMIPVLFRHRYRD
ncbi:MULTISPECIES: hypothetical protein [Rahnella]